MSLSEFEWQERARLVESAAAIDRLDLGVEFEAGAAGLAKCRGRGGLEAAERGVDQVSGGGAIDLDGTGFDIIGEVVDIAWITRRDRGRQAVFGVVGLGDCVL